MAARKKQKVQLYKGLSAADTLAVLKENPSCTSGLRYLHKALLDGGQAAESFGDDLVTHGFLQLIPSILRQSSRRGAARGIEVLGALSMSSFKTHCKIVKDKHAMCALSDMFRSTDVNLLTSACHTVVDLLITPFGCEALMESAMLKYLLRLLCWVADLSIKSHSCTVAEGDCPVSWAEVEPVPVSRGALKLSEVVSCDFETSFGQPKIVESLTSTVQDKPFCTEYDELFVTALTAVNALLPYHGVAKVSTDVPHNVLRVLRKYWRIIQEKDHTILQSTMADGEPSCNHRARHLLARCVVQLAMVLNGFGCRKLSEQQGLFRSTELSVDVFLEKYWEQSPVLLSREMPTGLLVFSETFTTLAVLVKEFLAWCVACPPAFADEVDHFHLFEGIESNLGGPMIYGQDIRLVKTVVTEADNMSTPTLRSDEVEMHYNGKGESSYGEGSRLVYPQEILKAVQSGYTVAIKGMELRYPDIANIADCLARRLGQPSVGANLYLTPPDAQGLNLHFDDHCVFVCQLAGHKTWNTFPPQKVLPRLYADRILDLGAVKDSPSTLFKLEKGDVLYIPKGFPHKAHLKKASQIGSSNFLASSEQGNVMEDVHVFGDNAVEKSSRSLSFGDQEHCRSRDILLDDAYSLHITFGIEVEPPFEWEGFVHIALRLWAQNRWQMLAACSHSSATKESDHRVELLSEALLHIAIRILGEKELVLRKACMIAASTPSPRQSMYGEVRGVSECPGHVSGVSVCGSDDAGACKFCDPGSVAYFQTLLELIVKKANYDEAYSFADRVSDDCTDCFTGWLEWLRHIPCSGGERTTSLIEPVSLAKSMIQSKELKELSTFELEATFGRFKVEFGDSLMFHHASNAFKTLWSKYRTIRERFTSGMLALHDSGH